MNHDKDKNPLAKGVIAKNFAGVGPVTREMLGARAIELALIGGRGAGEVTQADYEQAKREFRGEPDQDSQDEFLESLPESARTGVVLDTVGREDPEPPSEDEDSEGRNESAQLVEEGVQEAEHDLMVESAKKEKRSS